MEKTFFQALRELATMAEGAEMITFKILEIEFGHENAVELHEIYKKHLDHRI